MALTEQQTLNTQTFQFDTELRYFAGPSYAALAKAGIAAAIGLWTDPANTQIGWTEITDAEIAKFARLGYDIWYKTASMGGAPSSDIRSKRREWAGCPVPACSWPVRGSHR